MMSIFITHRVLLLARLIVGSLLLALLSYSLDRQFYTSLTMAFAFSAMLLVKR